MTKIPKIIHYVWLGGVPLDEKTLNYIETWKTFCPDYEIKEWNENNFDTSACEFLKEAIKAKQWAFASDYIRLKVLYEYGGIYFDTDIKLLKNFDEFLINNSVLGFENSGYLQAAVIMCAPKQQWVADLIYIYEHSHFKIKNKIDNVPNTIKITSFLVKNYGLKIKNEKQMLKNEILILPNEYFAPKDYTTGKINILDNTITYHDYNSSWLDDTAKFQQKFLRGVRKLFGKRIFDWFIKMYMKTQVAPVNRKLNKQVKEFNKSKN